MLDLISICPDFFNVIWSGCPCRIVPEQRIYRIVQYWILRILPEYLPWQNDQESADNWFCQQLFICLSAVFGNDSRCHELEKQIQIDIRDSTQKTPISCSLLYNPCAGYPGCPGFRPLPQTWAGLQCKWLFRVIPGRCPGPLWKYPHPVFWNERNRRI